MNISILEKTKTVLSSNDDGGPIGIMCLEMTHDRLLRSAMFTSKREDIDNVMLEELLQDRATPDEDYFGSNFKSFENGYLYDDHCKFSFDSVGSEDHQAFLKGKEFFFNHMNEKFSDVEKFGPIDNDWNEREWSRYSENLFTKDGSIAYMMTDRRAKIFFYAGKNHYQKFVDSVKGLKFSPESHPTYTGLFEYQVGLIDYIDDQPPFWLSEWINEINKIPNE